MNEATLPVNFKGFQGKKVARGTQLIWDVADEFNVSRYEVQKGSDGGSFKTIGIVFAGEKSAYTFVDEQPSQGVSFYRIRSIDVDGKFKFSTVISFSNGKSAAILRAYPMPARNQVTLQHGAIEGKAQVTISSEDGRIVKRQVLTVGSMLTSIDLSSLKAGLYLLRLENSNGEVETLKLVKQ
ncbi:MAG TPA: T9SS type A sorting domain-containing protein [Chitinophagaceae bacterium]